MPYTIHLNSDQTRVVIQLSGKVTGKEIIAINDNLIKNTNCVSQIWDFLKTENVDISIKEIHNIAMQDRFLPDSSILKKVAIVATKEISKGLDELYEHFSLNWVGRSHNFKSESFTSFNEANEWVYNNE